MRLMGINIIVLVSIEFSAVKFTWVNVMVLVSFEFSVVSCIGTKVIV